MTRSLAPRKPVTQHRIRTVSGMQWWRCQRCNRLCYSQVMGAECAVCTDAAEMVFGLGPVVGEISGC